VNYYFEHTPTCVRVPGTPQGLVLLCSAVVPTPKL